MKNVEINAIGSFAPGEYGTVEVNGVGKCDGAVMARELEVNGVLKCGGAVRCDRAEINGTLDCVDRLDAGEMEINGAVKVSGTAGVEKLEVDGAFTVQGNLLECDELECDGSIAVEGSIRTRTLEIDGSLKAGGDVEADEARVDGVLKVGGQMSADHVHVEGVVSASEVVGDEVIIWNESRRWGHGVNCTIVVGRRTIQIGGGREEDGEGPVSKVGLIEATTIALRCVEATTVNGTDVTIGPGCVIENLDCNGILHLDPAARVKNITGEYTQVDA